MNFYSDIDKYENRIVIVTAEGEEVSYRQFIADGQTLFADVPARTLIFIVCENCLESVCAYIGALRKRVVPVMVNAGIDSELFQKLYLTYQPRYIFMPQAWNQTIADTCDKVQAYRNYELYQTDCTQEYEIYPELALLLQPPAVPAARSWFANHMKISLQTQILLPNIWIYGWRTGQLRQCR